MALDHPALMQGGSDCGGDESGRLVHVVRFQRTGKGPEKPATTYEGAHGEGNANEMFARDALFYFRARFGRGARFFLG